VDSAARALKRLLVVFGLVTATTGCSADSADRPGKLLVGTVHIDAETPEAVRAALEAELGASPEFGRSEDADAGAMELVFARRSDAVLRLNIAVRDDDETLDAAVELERAKGSVDWAEDVPLLVRRGLALLAAQRTLERGGDAQARALLRGDDTELVLLALEWAAEHRRVGLLDAMRLALGHPDPRISLAAIDALAVVGTPEDVPRLIEAARLSDRDHTGRLYAALGWLGGPEAVGFLTFAARNEEDPVLAELARASAEQARTRPAARRQPSPPLARGHRNPPPVRRE